jgi:c-di-GMP-binding flagellar brake protein YcgR
MGYRGSERREYFRVYDNLIVEYRIVAEAMTERPLGVQLFKSSSTPLLLRELEELSALCESAGQPLEVRDPEMANIVVLLSRRIDIMTELIIASREEESYVESRPVTLSEGGMSFRNAASLPEGTFLALKLIFLPSHQTLRLYGRVAQCTLVEPGDIQPNNVGIEFVRVGAVDRSTLARYVMQKQIDSRSVMDSEEAPE